MDDPDRYISMSGNTVTIPMAVYKDVSSWAGRFDPLASLALSVTERSTDKAKVYKFYDRATAEKFYKEVEGAYQDLVRVYYQGRPEES